MSVIEDTMIEIRKNLDVSVGNVIAGTKEEIKKEKKKIYYLKNKNKILKKLKENYDPIKKSKYNKKYRTIYKEKWLAFKKRYYYERKGKEKVKEYKIKNKDKINAWTRNYKNKKLIEDPFYKLSKNIRARIRMALIKNSTFAKKSKSTLELIGCTIEQLWIHLESKFTHGMTRKNYGKWHIDHIRPCASFNLTDPKQQKECFHYTNLQPLWALDNIKKGDRY